jgi:hypothetical protein
MAGLQIFLANLRTTTRVGLISAHQLCQDENDLNLQMQNDRICTVKPNIEGALLPPTVLGEVPSSTPDENRQPTPSPLSGHCLEATWQSRIAECTAATLIKVVASKLVPIALDEQLTSLGDIPQGLPAGNAAPTFDEAKASLRKAGID